MLLILSAEWQLYNLKLNIVFNIGLVYVFPCECMNESHSSNKWKAVSVKIKYDRFSKYFSKIRDGFKFGYRSSKA
jgi:hypothetical protein